MALSKTFRKKRKYKHSNKHSNNNTKRTSKRTSKRTYKKRRTMKGGWSGQTLVNGATAILETAAGDELSREGKRFTQTQARTGVAMLKQELLASGAPSAIVNAAERRVKNLANDPETQERALRALERTGSFLIQQSKRTLDIIKQELVAANAKKVALTLEEQQAKDAEDLYTEIIKETQLELTAAEIAATEKAAAEKATAEKAALAEKVAAEKAAASATAEKVAAEKAATAAAA